MSVGLGSLLVLLMLLLVLLLGDPGSCFTTQPTMASRSQSTSPPIAPTAEPMPSGMQFTLRRPMPPPQPPKKAALMSGYEPQCTFTFGTETYGLVTTDAVGNVAWSDGITACFYARVSASGTTYLGAFEFTSTLFGAAVGLTTCLGTQSAWANAPPLGTTEWIDSASLHAGSTSPITMWFCSFTPLIPIPCESSTAALQDWFVLTYPIPAPSTDWSSICPQVSSIDGGITRVGIYNPVYNLATPAETVLSLAGELASSCAAGSMWFNYVPSPPPFFPLAAYLDYFGGGVLVSPVTSSFSWGLCSWGYTSCTPTFSGWYLQPLNGRAPEDYFLACLDQITGSFSGTVETPTLSAAFTSGISSLASTCSIGNYIIPGQSTPTSASYVLCSLSPLVLTPLPTLTLTVTTRTQSTTAVETSTVSTSVSVTTATIRTTVSTSLIISTSTTTRTTSTVTLSSVSSVLTTASTTTTTTRTVTSLTETTTTLAFTQTDTVGLQTTSSFTVTDRESQSTTETVLLTRRSCPIVPTTTTVTLVPSTVTRTVQTTDRTVTVETTVYVTASSSRRSPPPPQSTRTVCSVSTVLDLTTDIVFRRKDPCAAGPARDGCPPLSADALFCRPQQQRLLAGPLVFLYNAAPYNLAECVCRAVGRQLAVVDPAVDLPLAYDLVRDCGGASGNAWVQVASDFTRCYQIMIDGARQYLVPAVSCDLALPVLCR